MKRLFFIIAAVILIAAIVFAVYYPKLEKKALRFLASRQLPAGSGFGDIIFDKAKNLILIRDYFLPNIPGYQSKNILEINQITIKLAGKLYGQDSLRAEEIALDGAKVFVERDKEGKFNVEKLQLADQRPKTTDHRPQTAEAADQMLLPAKIILNKCDIYALDHFPKDGIRKFGIYDIDATVNVLDRQAQLGSVPVDVQGKGKLNQNKSGTLEFKGKTHYSDGNLHFDSDYKLTGLDLKEIAPYLNERTPFHVKSGKANGFIVFTFNGTDRTIGLNNTFEFVGLEYAVKEGMGNAQFIETSAAVLSKYLASQKGGIIFDFKIKGPVDDPKFYLGPIAKRGVALAFIDTVGNNIIHAPAQQIEKLSVPNLYNEFMKIIGK